MQLESSWHKQPRFRDAPGLPEPPGAAFVAQHEAVGSMSGKIGHTALLPTTQDWGVQLSGWWTAGQQSPGMVRYRIVPL